MDTDVIIARAGGGMEQDASGGMIQKKDQSMSECQVRAVLNDITLQNPVIIICGERNSNTQVQLPKRYCVLGWFKPVMVWAEKTAGKGKRTWITVKYRFERLGGGDVWYAPQQPLSLSDAEKGEAGRVASRTCTGTCGKQHPQIYLEGWMCLDLDCDKFWQLEDGREAPHGAMTYHPAFLLDRTSWDVEQAPFDVRHPVPDVGKLIGDELTYINTRGVSCPKCGRCNQRYKFDHWVCDRAGCDWKSDISQRTPILPKTLHSPGETTGDGPSLARNKHGGGVSLKVEYKLGYKFVTYTFPGIKGSLTHAIANKDVNAWPKGPDAMLTELQAKDMGLERRRFRSQKMSGSKVEQQARGPIQSSAEEEPTGLPTPPHEATTSAVEEPTTSADDDDLDEFDEPKEVPKSDLEDGDFMMAFSMNYGMPYKFVASGASRSFDDKMTPWPIRECRSHLNMAARKFLYDIPDNFDLNEELVFAYLESQKLEYHDDGEEGLGPVIATLSLGGKAKMHMRIKHQHYFGCSKSGSFTPERPVPGGTGGKEMYEKRLQAWEELQKLKATDRNAYRLRAKEIPKELGIFEKRNKKAEDLVTITLSHGDIVLMQGYDIQKYLEHKVVSESYLRFALTCRTVLGHHLREHERPEYEVKPDDGKGYDGPLKDGLVVE